MSKVFQKFMQATVLTLSVTALNTQNVFAQDRRDFIVYNSNRLTITQLYVSPTNTQNWGRDILPGTLRSGSYTTVFFSDRSNRCVYDVMAVYQNGTYDVGRVNACQTVVINFSGDGGDYAPR